MTRIDSVRAATGTARDNVLHAAEVVAPKVSQAAQQARCTAGSQYHAHLAPRLENALDSLSPKVEAAATRAAQRTRQAARQATDYAAPRVSRAVADARAAAEPMREEAAARGGAALAALRGQASAAEIEKLVRKQRRRGRRGKRLKRLAVVGLLAGGAFAAWRWWSQQANPDWLVEPADPTEVDAQRAPLTTVDGSEPGAGTPQASGSKGDAETG